MSKWTLVVLLLLPLSGCGDSPAVKECIANGIAYFKSIGSYPHLTAKTPDQDRRAEDVAAERCRRTPTAFPKPR